MNFTLAKPCADCPFLKVGGIRLTQSRVREIAGGMLSSTGTTFACHRTTVENDDGDLVEESNSQHCAGALIFAEKHGTATQMMRIAERLRFYVASALDGASFSAVFDSIKDMEKINRQEVRR